MQGESLFFVLESNTDVSLQSNPSGPQNLGFGALCVTLGDGACAIWSRLRTVINLDGL